MFGRRIVTTARKTGQTPPENLPGAFPEYLDIASKPVRKMEYKTLQNSARRHLKKTDANTYASLFENKNCGIK